MKLRLLSAIVILSLAFAVPAPPAQASSSCGSLSQTRLQKLQEVDRSGHGTLTFIRGSTREEDSIQYSFVQDKGKITLGVGTCPDIDQCTGMHPGAESSGYWSRKKP